MICHAKIHTKKIFLQKKHNDKPNGHCLNFLYVKSLSSDQIVKWVIGPNFLLKITSGFFIIVFYWDFLVFSVLCGLIMRQLISFSVLFMPFYGFPIKIYPIQLDLLCFLLYFPYEYEGEKKLFIWKIYGYKYLHINIYAYGFLVASYM